MVFSQYLRSLGADNLGSSGSLFLLDLMGASEAPSNFCERALHHISLFSQEKDWREDEGCLRFGGPALHKRVFCYAEYRLRCSPVDSDFLEGAILQENSAPSEQTTSAPQWFRAVQLPVNYIVDRTMCTEFLLLREWSGVLVKAGVALCDLKVLQGDLRLYATGPPCVS